MTKKCSFILISLLTFSIFLYGCGPSNPSDDSSVPQTPAQTESSILSENPTSSAAENPLLNTVWTLSECYQNNSQIDIGQLEKQGGGEIHFLSDNTCKINILGQTFTATYAVNKGTIFFTIGTNTISATMHDQTIRLGWNGYQLVFSPLES